MCDYSLPAWKGKQLKKFHKTLKKKHEAYHVNTVLLPGTDYTPSQVVKVTTIGERIAVAKSEQIQGVGQILPGIHQVETVVQQSTADAVEMTSITNERSVQVLKLQHIINKIRLR